MPKNSGRRSSEKQEKETWSGRRACLAGTMILGWLRAQEKNIQGRCTHSQKLQHDLTQLHKNQLNKIHIYTEMNAEILPLRFRASRFRRHWIIYQSTSL